MPERAAVVFGGEVVGANIVRPQELLGSGKRPGSSRTPTAGADPISARGSFRRRKRARAHIECARITFMWHRRGGIYAARGFAWAAVGGVRRRGGIYPSRGVHSGASVRGASRTPPPTAIRWWDVHGTPPGRGRACPARELTRGRAVADGCGGQGSGRPTDNAREDFSHYKGRPRKPAAGCGHPTLRSYAAGTHFFTQTDYKTVQTGSSRSG